MKPRLLLPLFSVLAFVVSAAAQTTDYAAAKVEAERLFAEKSFAKAREAYAKINLTNLPPVEQRWVQFRLADTQWRSEAATQRADTTKLDAARDALDKMVRDIQRTEDKDRVWVEVQESLGDFWWTRRDQMNWGAAWPFYQQALDWWAGQSVSDEARQRYLDVVWRTAKPPRAEPYYRYGNYGNILPREILLNTSSRSPSPRTTRPTPTISSPFRFSITVVIGTRAHVCRSISRPPSSPARAPTGMTMRSTNTPSG